MYKRQECGRGRDRLSASLRGQIERGRQVTAVDYRKALARVPVLLESLDSLFDGCDALLTPATVSYTHLTLPTSDLV